jgi:hypothetical protein
MRIDNLNHRISFACIGIILLGIIGMDGFKGGYALSFFGGFVEIIGIISGIMFGRMARLQDQLLRKENILAHWTYSADEWRQ